MTLGARKRFRAPMAGNFRNGAYDALTEALKARREELGLTQLDVVAALPRWLGLDNTMLNKIEHKTRNVSHIEVRELARVLKTTVAELDEMAGKLEAGRHLPLNAKRPRKKR
jgi:transcriptional regulator with XRE-family HTH domain